MFDELIVLETKSSVICIYMSWNIAPPLFEHFLLVFCDEIAYCLVAYILVGEKLGGDLRNTLILLVMALPMIIGPNVGHAIADLGTHTDSADQSSHGGHSSQSTSVSQSDQANEEHEADCCHVDCVCCTAQGSGATILSGDAGAHGGMTVHGFKNLPFPHLEGLLRPPRFS